MNLAAVLLRALIVIAAMFANVAIAGNERDQSAGGGDPEYGAYLAAECLTCHGATAAASGIPQISGRPVPEFVALLTAYQSGAREHAVMQVIAARLGVAEMAALAAYFKGPD